ncbi:MAG: hypothetical protein GX275_05015 [Clostridiales bacterium]|nr:hypothetical protein [Clostridiales bacterium]
MDIQKIRIISNNICYGPEPQPTDEIEQHLTISSIGRVWFSSYNYSGGYGKYKISRKHQFAISKAITNKIMELFSLYADSEYIPNDITDCGMWEMTITNNEGKEYKFMGSLCEGMCVKDIDLSCFLREYIYIDRLFVFDGDIEYDN